MNHKNKRRQLACAFSSIPAAGKLTRMSSLDLDLVRHALETARDHGFAEIEMGVDQGSFRARLDAAPKKPKAPSSTVVAGNQSVEAEFKYVKAHLVGYYQTGKGEITAGSKIAKAQNLGSISALGIANDIESKIEGEVVEVLVSNNQPVEFGQPLFKVKA